MCRGNVGDGREESQRKGKGRTVVVEVVARSTAPQQFGAVEVKFPELLSNDLYRWLQGCGTPHLCECVWQSNRVVKLFLSDSTTSGSLPQYDLPDDLKPFRVGMVSTCDSTVLPAAELTLHSNAFIAVGTTACRNSCPDLPRPHLSTPTYVR